VSTREDSGDNNKTSFSFDNNANSEDFSKQRYTSIGSQNSSNVSLDISRIRLPTSVEASPLRKISRTSLVKPLDNELPSNSKNLNLKSLKSVISTFNEGVIEEMEKNYNSWNPKYATLALTLGQIYIEGKRAPKNFRRAAEILSISWLPESKWILMKLAFDMGKYTEAFYYAEMLSCTKCVWDQGSSAPKTMRSSIFKMKPKWGSKELRSNLVLPPQKCLYHLNMQMQRDILAIVGAKEVSLYKKEASNSRFQPCWEDLP